MEQATRQASFDQASAQPTPILRELAFLVEHTGQDELTLLSEALDLGLGVLYRQAVEQSFIDETLARGEAVVVFGAQRVADIEYAKQALVQDIGCGLDAAGTPARACGASVLRRTSV